MTGIGPSIHNFEQKLIYKNPILRTLPQSETISRVFNPNPVPQTLGTKISLSPDIRYLYDEAPPLKFSLFFFLFTPTTLLSPSLFCFYLPPFLFSFRFSALIFCFCHAYGPLFSFSFYNFALCFFFFSLLCLCLRSVTSASPSYFSYACRTSLFFFFYFSHACGPSLLLAFSSFGFPMPAVYSSPLYSLCLSAPALLSLFALIYPRSFPLLSFPSFPSVFLRSLTFLMLARPPLPIPALFPSSLSSSSPIYLSSYPLLFLSSSSFFVRQSQFML